MIFWFKGWIGKRISFVIFWSWGEQGKTFLLCCFDHKGGWGKKLLLWYFDNRGGQGMKFFWYFYHRGGRGKKFILWYVDRRVGRGRKLYFISVHLVSIFCYLCCCFVILEKINIKLQSNDDIFAINLYMYILYNIIIFYNCFSYTWDVIWVHVLRGWGDLGTEGVGA